MTQPTPPPNTGTLLSPSPFLDTASLPSVIAMTHSRLPYDDAEAPDEMIHDAEEVDRHLHLSEHAAEHAAEAHPEHKHHENHVPEVSEDLAQKGRDIHLHFH